MRIAGAILAVGLALVAGVVPATAQPPGPQVTYSSTVSASPNPAVSGQSVTLTATVTSSDSSNPGPIQFQASPYGITGNCNEQPVNLLSDGSWQATCTTMFTEPVTESIVALDANAANKTDPTPLQLKVDPAPTTMTIGSPAAAPVVGSGVSYVATVGYQGMAGGPFPSGTTTFFNDGSPVSGCQNVPTGEPVGGGPVQAVCDTEYTAAGTYAVTAAYSGNQFFAPSTSPALRVTVGAVAGGRLKPCPGQDARASARDLARARAAVRCLLDEVLARYGEAPISEPASLDSWVQAHPDAQPPPSARSWPGGLGFSDGGPTTPYGVVAALMRVRYNCQVLLNGATVEGLGFVDRPVLFGVPKPAKILYAQAPAWAIVLGETKLESVPPSVLKGCPHPLPIDAARQGAPPPAPAVGLEVANRSGRHLEGKLFCTAHSGCEVEVQPTLPGAGAGATGRARKLRLKYGISTVQIDIGTAALDREERKAAPVLKLTVQQLRPRRLTFASETRIAHA